MSVGSEGMVLCLDLALTDPLSVNFIPGGNVGHNPPLLTHSWVSPLSAGTGLNLTSSSYALSPCYPSVAGGLVTALLTHLSW